MLELPGTPCRPRNLAMCIDNYLNIPPSCVTLVQFRAVHNYIGLRLPSTLRVIRQWQAHRWNRTVTQWLPKERIRCLLATNAGPAN
jgi:hypothetical protein